MKNITYLFIASLFTVLTSLGQNQQSSKKVNLNLAQNSFHKLENGALLIRLKTNKNKIDALIEHGYIAESEKVKHEQEAYNKEIMKAFREEFNFCPYFFFYSENSESVRLKDFSKAIFLNENLEIDETISMNSDEFLTAEFGNIAQDTTMHKDSYIVSTHDGYHKKESYWGGPIFQFGALVIMNDEFIQLKSPFPYYIRTFSSIPLFKRSKYKVVAKLNEKLIEFKTQ